MDIHAVVLDFDGLILDTEWPHYRSWCEQFEARGAELALDRWVTKVGSHPSMQDDPFDPCAELEALIGRQLDHDEVRAEQQARWFAMLDAAGPRPGIVELIDAADQRGLPLGVASSSTRGWVTRHLERLELMGRFRVVLGRDDVGGRAKPAPDVYTDVVRRLGVEPVRAVAFEDSLNGVRSAAAAGLTVVAVPNEVTRMLPLADEADLVVEDLGALGLAGVLDALDARAAS